MKKTNAQKYNDRLENIWQNARNNGALPTSDKPINPFLIHKLKTIFDFDDRKAVQAVNMVRTLDK